MFERTPHPTARHRQLVRTATKLTLIAVWLMVVFILVRELPGIDHVLPRTEIPLVAVVGAGASIVIVGVLLLIAPRAASLVRTELDGPEIAVEGAASIAYWGVTLVAIIVGHRGFAGVLRPVLGELSWVYDIAFLVLSVPPMVIIAARLYDGVDPAADHVADRVTRRDDTELDA